MKDLLFVAPAVPRPTGSGLRMRGWLFLKGLAQQYRITLIAGSPGFPDESPADLDAVSHLIDDAVLLSFRSRLDPALLQRRLTASLISGRGATSDWAEPTPTMRQRLARLRGRTFVGVHVFRLYMLPTAMAALHGHPDVPVQLDLDDWESQTRFALAALADRHDPQRADALRAQAATFEQQEGAWLPRVARVFACSSDDAAALALRYGLQNVAVVGNAVAVPDTLNPPTDAEPVHLLFIGSLGYYPNQDAVHFLLNEVLPPLRSVAPCSFRLVVAGVGAPPRLRARLRTEPGVVWIDAPAEVEPLYARAALALAPVRAGGGTRVKALEAFAQGRPLVATAAAVAGLDVEAGEHYLRAEDASEWVQGLRTLLATPAVGARLASNAYAWVCRHSLDAAVSQVAALAVGI